MDDLVNTIVPFERRFHFEFSSERLALMNEKVERLYCVKTYRPTVVALIAYPPRGFLLVQSPQSSNWCFMQGGIRRNEDVLAALYRELGEELGISRALTRLLPLAFTQIVAGPPKRGFLHGSQFFLFGIECASEPVLDIDPLEIGQAKWHTFLEAREAFTRRTFRHPEKKQLCLRALALAQRQAIAA